MKIRSWHLNAFLTFLLTTFLGPFFLDPRPANCQEIESSNKKIVTDLKKRISELQEGNALLMENLVNCVGENNELRQKTGKKVQKLWEQIHGNEIFQKNH